MRLSSRRQFISGADLQGHARDLLASVLGVDLRTLALFRIAVATMVIADLVMRSRDLTAHYTDQGIVPRVALLGEFGGGGLPSLHLMSGSAKVEALLFIIAGVIALAMLVGYRTRLATIASWILLLSLQARNSAISQGADLLLRLLLFWGMFLPLGARFAIDAALDRRVDDEPNPYFSMATMALLLQVMSVYFFTALLKTSRVWIPDGTAVFYALHIDYLATPFAVWLRQFRPLLQTLTYYVWTLELIAPILVFFPVFTTRIRIAVMALLIAMHIGFFLCMEIGIFPFVSITSLLVLTPGAVWDWLDARWQTSERRGLQIYYDQPCGFCLKVCLILRTMLVLGDTPIRPAQGEPGILRELQQHNSWVVVDYDGTHHVRWQAVALVFRRSPILWPIGMLFGSRAFRAVGEWIYATIARNRGRLGDWSAVTLPYREQSIHPAPIANAIIAALAILIVFTNIRSRPGAQIHLPGFAEGILGTLRLSQKWEMFAPAPSRIDGWYVVRGVTADGQPVDVLHDRPGEPDFGRPEYLSHEYETYRWRKYLIALKNDDHAKYRPYYAKYVCSTWNARHPRSERLDKIDVYFNREIITLAEGPRPVDRELLIAYSCAPAASERAEPDAGSRTDSF